LALAWTGDGKEKGSQASASATSRVWPLLCLNFFMADMQSGIGPFVGVFLLSHGWGSGLIGTVMTIGNVAGMLITIPVGAAVDTTNHKRAWVVIPGFCVVAASAMILISQQFWVVATSQVATSIAGAAIVPAVTGITLGIARQKGFNRQIGRNQAFNHGGNLVGAALSGYLGWKFGYTAVFLLAALFGGISVLCVLSIPANSIDHAAARGANDDKKAKPDALHILLKHKALIVLAAALAAFHLGNGAMLPLYGLAAVSSAKADGPAFVALTIIIAQAVMIVASIAAMKLGETRGYWLIMLISFSALPIRGLFAYFSASWWGVYPVQILDGVGVGLQSVAIPGMVARSLNGTGRINAGQGAVLTVQNLGAALSPALGGWIAQSIGYTPTFLGLGSLGLVAVAIWVTLAPRA
jgi:MFS family permease